MFPSLSFLHNVLSFSFPFNFPTNSLASFYKPPPCLLSSASFFNNIFSLVRQQFLRFYFTDVSFVLGQWPRKQRLSNGGVRFEDQLVVIGTRRSVSLGLVSRRSAWIVTQRKFNKNFSSFIQGGIGRIVEFKRMSARITCRPLLVDDPKISYQQKQYEDHVKVFDIASF